MNDQPNLIHDERLTDKLSRPELILLLLYEPGQKGKLGEPVTGKTRLMKLLFLLSKEEDIDEYLSQKQEFVPFRYGPFDAEVYDDLEALKELKLVEESTSRDVSDTDSDLGETYDADTLFRLTASGMSKAQELSKGAPKDVIRRVTGVKTNFGSMPLLELLHYVYSKYEEYAKLSEAKL